MEVFTLDLTAVGPERVHAHQTMDEIRNAAQRRLQFFRRFAGNAGAETARRHIDKAGFFIHLSNIDGGSLTENGQL